MQYMTTLGGRQFAVNSNVPLTQQQVNYYASQKMQGAGGCPSCAGAKAAGSGGVMRLGTATCPTTAIALNSTHTLTGSVVSGGTAPFTYTWTITPPTGTPVTLTGASQSYTFTQAGSYTVAMTVTDSCTAGAKTDSASCTVTVSATCTNPNCTFVMS